MARSTKLVQGSSFKELLAQFNKAALVVDKEFNLIDFNMIFKKIIKNLPNFPMNTQLVDLVHYVDLAPFCFSEAYKLLNKLSSHFTVQSKKWVAFKIEQNKSEYFLLVSKIYPPNLAKDLTQAKEAYFKVFGYMPHKDLRIVEMLQEIQFHYENIITNMPGSVYWKDLNGVYRGCNQELADMIGVKSPSDLIGLDDYDLERLGWAVGLADTFRKDDFNVMNSATSLLSNEESPIYKKDGTVLYQLTNKIPLRNKNTKVNGVLGISTNITKIKEAEEKVVQANAGKSNFMTAIDRMIRNPLSSSLGTAQLLRETKLGQKQSEMVETIIDSVQEITPMLDRVQSYLELEDGSLKSIQNIFELRPFIKSYLDKYYAIAVEKSINFYFKCDSILPQWVKADSYFLSQIINNLLDNAMKYTSHGSVTLNLRFLGMVGDQVTCNLIVEDTGQGMRPETQACLFNFFDQVKKTEEEKFTEPGLNLSITAKMIQIMLGAIEVKSKVNKGTTFTVRLSLQQVTPPTYEKNSISGVNLSNKPVHLKRPLDSHITILIIEDNPTAHRVLKMMLEHKYNSTVVSAYTLKSAFELDASQFDIIFVDINLPDGIGTDFIKKTIEHLGQQAPPQVAVTSYSTEDEKNTILEAGARDVITKPVDLEVLISVINGYVFEEHPNED